MNKIAFTSSIPLEVIIAAGKTPLDLNNVFITADRPQDLVAAAEEEGYPRTTCGWIKGLYSCAQLHDIEALIAVMQGDCSNTQALMETLQLKGIEILPFAYPYDRDYDSLDNQINKLCSYFQVSREQVSMVKADIDEVRSLCAELDRLTWEDNLISGEENHYYLVNASDFQGNIDKYRSEISALIEGAQQRAPFGDEVRLAYIGVPPIFTDFYEVLHALGARVVFNEVQRQFSMPYKTTDIVEQYLKFTYPYGAFARLQDISAEIKKRNIQGIIHYTQTFCFRQIEDLIYRKSLNIPFLTIEGDNPGRVDARSRLRLEAFINMLKQRC